MDIPNELKLREILNVYDVSLRQFYKRTKVKIMSSSKDQIIDILTTLNEEELKIVLKVIKGLKGVIEDG